MRDLRELNMESGPVALPPPTAEQLAVVEELVGAKLPAAYVAFLRFSNGGYPELNTCYFDDGERRRRWIVNNFYHIAANSRTVSDTEDVVWQHCHRLPSIPKRTLPFAGNSGGDSLFLDLSEEGEGRVVLYTHDPPSGPITVADSFEAFIDALVPEPDDIAAIWT